MGAAWCHTRRRCRGSREAKRACFVSRVCGDCERSQERRMKGIGFLEIRVRRIAGWARFEAVEKFCGKKVEMIGGTVEVRAVFVIRGRGSFRGR